VFPPTRVSGTSRWCGSACVRYLDSVHPVRRRFVGAFVHLLMLHLLLVGSGDACVLPAVARAAHSLSAADGTPAGDMTGMAMPSHSAPSDGRECDGSGGPPTGHEQPAPACQSMAPCAPAALAATPAAVERPTTLVEAGPLGVVVLVPPSRTSAPEPPPPRA